MGRAIDHSGQKFGRLTVIEKSPIRVHGNIAWKCRCDCGNEVVTSGANLRQGDTTSCGCYHKEVAAQRASETRATHGLSDSPEYNAWHSMIKRCGNSNSHNYENYGGRGISVCERWLTSFEAFYNDMGPRPTDQHSLDRFPDNNGNYEPGNCRWATAEEQANNRRNNNLVEHNGVTMSVTQFAKSENLSLSMVKYRMSTGHSVQDILNSKA